MKLTIRLITALTICTTILACSSQKSTNDDPTPPLKTPHTEASDGEEAESSQNRDTHDLGILHHNIQETIRTWYEAEDHGDEIRTLAVFDESRPDLKAETELRHLELVERRSDPTDENYCYEGVIFVDIQDSQIQSVGRYGHDCCPGVECEMGPENWMGRLFNHTHHHELEGVRQLIHPDEGVILEATWSDREDDSSGSEQWHLTASEFPGERGDEFLSCGPNFMAGFSFSCSDVEEGFICDCYVAGISTRWTWKWVEEEAYLIKMSQAYDE